MYMYKYVCASAYMSFIMSRHIRHSLYSVQRQVIFEGYRRFVHRKLTMGVVHGYELTSEKVHHMLDLL